MSTAEVAIHGGRGRRPAQRARLSQAYDIERPLVRLVTFAALGLYGVLRWATLQSAAPGWRLAGLLGLAVTVAGAGPWLDRRSRPLALAGVVLAFLAMLAIAGIPVAWLIHARVAVITQGIGMGLTALPNSLVPYLGTDPWLRLVIVLGAGVLLLDAAITIAFAPNRLGDLRRAVAALPLIALAVVPATLMRPQLPYLQGVILFALVAAFVWGERVLPGRRLGAAAVGGTAALAGLIFGPAIELNHPWVNPRGLAGSVTPVHVDTFDWTQRYGPFNWPRDNNDVLDVKARRPDYWKAENLDVFNGVAWATGSGVAGSQVPGPSATSLRRWTQTITVTIRSMSTTEVIGGGFASAPQGISQEVMQSPSPGTWATAVPLRPGDTYTISTYSPDPSPAALAAEHGGYPLARVADELTIGLPWKGLQTGAPNEVLFPPFHSDGPVQNVIGPAGVSGNSLVESSPYARAYMLAAALAARAATPFAFVQAVERFLTSANGFVYDERPPPSSYPLESFLFSSKHGYCQQFAGAMALLLRMGGVPARVATGFTTGDYDAAAHHYVVSDLDAHAWVEVWFPRYGWVRFDPTPATAPARAGSAGLLPALGPGGASKAIHRPDRRSLGRTGAAPLNLNHRGSGGGLPFVAAVSVLVVLMGGALLIAFVRARRVPTAQQLVVELERALARSGRPLQSGVTLYALERRFRDSPDAQGYVRGLRLSRFGGTHELPRPSERRALRSELARGRGVAGRLRAWWALPPRVLN